ncbi:MAG: hypothetical protein TREMPRED_005262, partial [Tremellales sp. Tagirdzhanova-0007]
SDVCSSDLYYILGSVIASWVIFGTSYLTSSWGWRIPYILQVPLSLYILIAVQFVPETPRFLLSKGREEEAFRFLVEYHGNGDPNDELVLFEFQEMKSAIKLEQAAKAETWSRILNRRSNLHRLGLASLMVFCTNLSGSSIIYFYYSLVFDLVGITNPTTQTGISAGLSVFTWFCQIAAVFVYAFRAVCLRMVGKAMRMLELLPWFWFGYTSAASIFQTRFYILTFSMRSKGLLVWNTLSQFAGAYVTWVDAIALNAIGYKYYIVYMPLVIIQWILIWKYMVETRGYTLEEIAIAFDGPNAQIELLGDAEVGVQEDPDVGKDDYKS